MNLSSTDSKFLKLEDSVYNQRLAAPAAHKFNNFQTAYPSSA